MGEKKLSRTTDGARCPELLVSGGARSRVEEVGIVETGERGRGGLGPSSMIRSLGPCALKKNGPRSLQDGGAFYDGCSGQAAFRGGRW